MIWEQKINGTVETIVGDYPERNYYVRFYAFSSITEDQYNSNSGIFEILTIRLILMYIRCFENLTISYFLRLKSNIILIFYSRIN